MPLFLVTVSLLVFLWHPSSLELPCFYKEKTKQDGAEIVNNVTKQRKKSVFKQCFKVKINKVKKQNKDLSLQ